MDKYENKDINELIKRARVTKIAMRVHKILNPEDSGAYAKELLTEITAKLVVADALDKDLKPTVSILEQMRDVLNDVLGSDNFDV